MYFSFTSHVFKEEDDMGNELCSSPMMTPDIIHFGQQFFVVAERQIIVKVNSFSKQCVHCLHVIMYLI